MEIVRRHVRFRCSCPYFEDHDGCKHIWATLLAADRENLIRLHQQTDDQSSDTVEEDDDDLVDFFPSPMTPRKCTP